MYRSFDKNCHETLIAFGYRFILIGDRINEDADFEVIPVRDEVNTHSSVVFDINSPEAIDLVSQQQPVGLFLDVQYVMAKAA